MTRSQFLQRPEGRIAYDVQGSGPLVVCVPGMGDNRASFRFLAPELVAAGYRVATMDLRGHGESDATFTGYDDVAAGTDVLALAEHLGSAGQAAPGQSAPGQPAPGQPAVLVGNSMGAGAVTWAAAERPDAVAALVLLGPFVRGGPLNPLLRVALDVALLPPWGRAFWLRWRRGLMKGGRPGDLAADEQALRASFSRPGAWRAVRRTTHTSHAPVQARLGEVAAPTLVVMGTKDPDFPDPTREAGEVAAALHGEVVLVDGAGHYPHVERPDLVAPAVLEHLRTVPARA